MKKISHRYAGLAFLLVILLLTCACGVPASSSAPDNSTSANGAPVDGATSDAPAAQTPENEVPAAASSGDILTLWTQEQNRLSAFDENGFYYLSTEKHLEGAENIKYIDFATRQETFLCANPNCTHDTEACTSYFVTENGACEVFLGYGHLFLLNNSGVEQNVIKMCDQDSSNARTLLALGDSQQLGGNFFAVDRDHCYFIISSAVQQGSDMRYQQSLHAVDIHTGEQREICELGNTDFCMGSCGQYFLMRRLDMENEIITEYAIDLQGQPTDALHLPPPWKAFTKFLKYTNDGIIYDIDFGESCTITALDIVNGGQRTVVENYPANSSWDSWFGAPTCNYMPTLSCPDMPDGSRRNDFYLLDLETGAYVDMAPAFIYEDGGRPQLISGQAETGDYILVRTGFEDVPTWAQGIGFGDTRTPIFALISKADYWAGNPNYITITDIDA